MATAKDRASRSRRRLERRYRRGKAPGDVPHPGASSARPSSAPTTCSCRTWSRAPAISRSARRRWRRALPAPWRRAICRFCTYRGHAHTLARGVRVEKVLGELMQRDNGLMRGKGGSMHLTSVDHGVMGSYAIIGAHLPIACGAAWRAQYKGAKDVSVCFFGDGTTNIGAFHEALNFAAVWKLPVIFVCENNLYMEYTPIGDVTAVRASGRRPRRGLRARAHRHRRQRRRRGLPHRAGAPSTRRARAAGPSLIECMTYRYSGHSRADPAKYRPEGELDRWKQRDPIKIYKERLLQFGVQRKGDRGHRRRGAQSRRRRDRSLQGRAAAAARHPHHRRLRRRRLGMEKLKCRN